MVHASSAVRHQRLLQGAEGQVPHRLPQQLRGGHRRVEPVPLDLLDHLHALHRHGHHERGHRGDPAGLRRVEDERRGRHHRHLPIPVGRQVRPRPPHEDQGAGQDRSHPLHVRGLAGAADGRPVSGPGGHSAGRAAYTYSDEVRARPGPEARGARRGGLPQRHHAGAAADLRAGRRAPRRQAGVRGRHRQPRQLQLGGSDVQVEGGPKGQEDGEEEHQRVKREG
mmetsp:Transcript_9381/g.25113  ORF Transcript_9381/g.25113 Transcript_9381/m.25113 type:complete len:224 (-) Transcript_9381:317-988(-)